MHVAMRSFTRALPRWMTSESSAAVGFVLAGAIWAVLVTAMGVGGILPGFSQGREHRGLISGVGG